MEILISVEIKDDRLPDLIEKCPEVVQACVEKAAFDVETISKEFCPVDTGNLQNSISTEVGDMTAEVTAHADYAAYVEFGTYKMAAQPYMVPAADKIAPEFAEAVGQAIGQLCG